MTCLLSPYSEITKIIMLFLSILMVFGRDSSYLVQNRLTYIYSSSVVILVLTKYM